MKLLIVFLISISTLAIGVDNPPVDSPFTRSQKLLILALQSPALVNRMNQTNNAEVISVRRHFILGGRASHEDYEVTYGISDGTGGFSEVDCMALTLNTRYETTGARLTEVDEFIPSHEGC